jgi:hypothetical protein
MPVTIKEGIYVPVDESPCPYALVPCAATRFFLRVHVIISVVVEGEAEIDHFRRFVQWVVVVSGMA